VANLIGSDIPSGPTKTKAEIDLKEKIRRNNFEDECDCARRQMHFKCLRQTLKAISILNMIWQKLLSSMMLTFSSKLN
jgi:hypothetical protein